MTYAPYPIEYSKVQEMIKAARQEERARVVETVKRLLNTYSVICPESSRAATFTPEQFLSLSDLQGNKEKE